MGKNSNRHLTIEDIHIGNKHTKKYSTSYIKKLQIKTRYHYATVRMAKILNNNTDADKDVEQEELSLTAGGNAEWYSFLEDSLAVSYKTKHRFTIPSSNHTSRYLSK